MTLDRGVSATQREAIARALADAYAGDSILASDDWRAADAVLGVVAGLVDEARRDEQERIKAAVRSELRACEGYGGLPPDPRSPEYGHWWIQLDEALERVDALGVIEGSEAS